VRGSASTGLSSPGAGLMFLAPHAPDGNVAVAGQFQIGRNRLALIDVPGQQVSILDLGVSVNTTAGLAFHPDGRRAYAIDYSAPALVEFEVGTAHISRRLPLDHVDVRDLLLVDAGHTLCAAIASRHDTSCAGDELSLAGLLGQVTRLDACAAPVPRSFRRSLADRVGRAVRLANRLERDVRHGRRGRAAARRRARLDHTLDALAT